MIKIRSNFKYIVLGFCLLLTIFQVSCKKDESSQNVVIKAADLLNYKSAIDRPNQTQSLNSRQSCGGMLDIYFILNVQFIPGSSTYDQEYDLREFDKKFFECLEAIFTYNGATINAKYASDGHLFIDYSSDQDLPSNINNLVEASISEAALSGHFVNYSYLNPIVTFNDYSCPIGGGGGPPVDPETQREANLADELAQNPNLLIDCELLSNFRELVTFKAPNIVNDRISSLNNTTSRSSLFSDPFYVHQINNAAGFQINLDRFEINVGMLPVINGTRVTAPEFLNYIRLNLNSFIDTENTSFMPYNDPNDNFNDTQRWTSANPLGSILHLDIQGDDGSVLVTSSTSNEWTVSTLRTPLDAQHPVSGNRRWGYTQDGNGYHFYVTGSDRLTSPGHQIVQSLTGVPFEKADELWESFQNKVSGFVNNHNGLASVGIAIKERPNYNDIRDYMDGIITLQELKNKKGCE